jgi:hypothetical protein
VIPVSERYAKVRMATLTHRSDGLTLAPWKRKRFLILIAVMAAISASIGCWVGFEWHCLQRELEAAAILSDEYGAALITGPYQTGGGGIDDDPHFDTREIWRGRLYVPVESVFIAGTPLDQRAWGCLASFRHLRFLKIQDCQFAPGLNGRFSEFRRLIQLDISETPLTMADVRSVAALRQLYDLTLWNTGGTDEWLEVLASMHGLRFLHVPEGDYSDVGVAHLAWLSQLEDLCVSESRITSRSGATFARLTALKRLILRNTSVDDDCLLQVAGLPALETLDLVGTEVTDAGMLHLTNLQRLEYLYLADTRITDIGVGYLSRLGSLVGIVLNGTRVTVDSLDILANLPHLNRSRVGAYDTQISEAQFKQWQTQ